MIRSTLNHYLVIRILTPLILALFVILSALSMERLLRLIDLASAQNAAISQIGWLLLYLQPHYLGLALPASLFLSIILAVRQLHDSSELVVMQAAGIPYMRLLTPVLFLAMIFTLIMIFLTSTAQPYGRYAYRAAIQNLTTQGESLRLQPGIFYQLSDDITIRADQVGQGGTLFKGFFAQFIAADGTQTMATSELAQIYKNPSDSSQSHMMHLTLTNARIVETPPNKSPTIITTQSYPLSLDMGMANAYGPRGQDKRELNYFELAKGGIPGVILEKGDNAHDLSIELHSRLVQSLSLPLLAILAIPLGLMGQGRTGKASGFIIGVVLLVLYEKTLSFAEHFAIKGIIPGWLGLWGAWCILCIGTAAFLAYKTGYMAPLLRRFLKH